MLFSSSYLSAITVVSSALPLIVAILIPVCASSILTFCMMYMSLTKLGVGDGQGSLSCCSPWGHKESDTTEQLNSAYELNKQGDNMRP